MSFLGSFFGTTQRNDVKRAKKKADAALDAGADLGRAAFGSATDRLDPYAQTGMAGNAMYADALGLNGRPAQQGVVDNFMSHPFRDQNGRWADDAMLRTFAARGMGDSGASRLAVSRANLERGSQDWNRWLDRIAGVGQQGLTASGTQAGLDAGLGQAEFGLGTTRAGNEINFGNAMAASRNTGVNNLLGLAGTVVSGFTPGWGGGTAFGNMFNAMSGRTTGAPKTPTFTPGAYPY